MRAGRFGFRASSSPPKLVIGLILLVLVISIVPMAKAEPPVAETTTWGTWTGTMPTVIQISDDIYRECDDETVPVLNFQACDIRYQFLKPVIDPAIAVLTFEGHSPNETLWFQVWNGTDYITRLKFDASATDYWFNYTFTDWELDLTGLPRISIVATSIPAQPDHTADIFIDVLTFRSWTDLSELERELERLKKQTNPDVIINQTELPTIPYGNRGLDDDVLFVDPYRTIVYSVKVSDSGSALTFSLPYPTTSDEVTVISDEIWIAPESYTRLWINDTAGSGTELLNVSTSVTYYNIEWGYAITVQTSGASSTVRADRVTTVRLIDSFNWGYNPDTGIFAHQSVIENDIAYNMENVRAYWAFPTEDSDGRDVQIDVSSIEVWDADNNLQLDKGRHYEATEAGGVSLEYRWVNTSGTSASRTIRIQFSRSSLTQSESYHTVYDNDISIADTYGNAPFTTNVHHTQHGTANFEGKIIIRFDLSGRYAGERIDVRSLIIKRSDTSLAQQYTYDSISNELRITDQSVGAGESITYTLYWDWYDEKSAVYELILGDPLILYSLLLLAGFSGLFIFLDATKEETKKKIGGILIIIVDVLILVIILVMG